MTFDLKSKMLENRAKLNILGSLTKYIRYLLFAYCSLSPGINLSEVGGDVDVVKANVLCILPRIAKSSSQEGRERREAHMR